MVEAVVCVMMKRRWTWCLPVFRGGSLVRDRLSVIDLHQEYTSFCLSLENTHTHSHTQTHKHTNTQTHKHTHHRQMY